MTRQKLNLDSILGDIFYSWSDRYKILYIPSIATQQVPDEQNDPTLVRLEQVLKQFQPQVLIVGNNAVPGFAIQSWRRAIADNQPLLIIRRGVDTRAIDKEAAKQQNISIANLPGINSPFVAQHMIKYLQLEQAQPQSKITVLGTGNIGRPIILKAIEKELNIQVISPSLQQAIEQSFFLEERGINPDKVICPSSIKQAFEEVNYLAVTIPWEHPAGGLNAGMIGVELIEKVSINSRVVSASPPRIFSPEALQLMNEKVKQGELFVRIDTAKRLAEEAQENYPYLNIAYNQAFAASECQQALDRAWLEKAKQFCSNTVRHCLVVA